MIRKEITTIEEVWQIHGVWAILGIVVCFYSSSFVSFAVTISDMALMVLITLYMKKRVYDKLVGIKILQGFSGLIHALVFSFFFAFITCRDNRGLLSVFILMVIFVSVMTIVINVVYCKLKIWEKSSVRQKSIPIFLVVLIPVLYIIKIRVHYDIILGYQIFCVIMIILQCIYTTNFSRARELVFENKTSRE